MRIATASAARDDPATLRRVACEGSRYDRDQRRHPGHVNVTQNVHKWQVFAALASHNPITAGYKYYWQWPTLQLSLVRSPSKNTLPRAPNSPPSVMSDPTYPVFSIFACLGFILVLIPLPWHFQAWNAGTCLYMAWTAVACLNQFVNSVVWHGNAYNPAPVWCDICESRFALHGPPNAYRSISITDHRWLVRRHSGGLSLYQ